MPEEKLFFVQTESRSPFSVSRLPLSSGKALRALHYSPAKKVTMTTTPYWSQILSMTRYDIAYLMLCAMSVGLIVGMNLMFAAQALIPKPKELS